MNRRQVFGRWLLAGGFLLLLAAALVFNFVSARGLPLNADFVRDYNEWLAMRGGNWILAHWVLSADNFYATDMPFYILTGMLAGAGFAVIYVPPFLIFTTLIMAGCLALWRMAPDHTARWRAMLFWLFLVGLPFAPGSLFLLNEAIHIGTMLGCLAAMLTIRPALRGVDLRWWRWAGFLALTVLVSASDPMAVGFCFGPLVLLLAGQAIASRRWDKTKSLAAGLAIAGMLAGFFLARNFVLAGGFAIAPVYTLALVPNMAAFERNVSAAISGLMLLFTAQPAVLDGSAWAALLVAFRTIAALIVIGLCGRAVWRGLHPRAAGGFSAWLALGAFAMAGLDIVNMTFAKAILGGVDFPGAAMRYLLPVYVFGSLAAAIEVLNLRRRHSGWWDGGLVLGCGLMLSFAAVHAKDSLNAGAGYQTSGPDKLITWLQHENLTYGVGPYWTAGMIEALSQGEVAVDPVEEGADGVVAFKQNFDGTNMAAGRRPEFAVFAPANDFGLTVSNMVAAYGRPVQALDVYGYDVLIFVALPQHVRA